MSQRVRIGMIGGGQGAFIGGVHRIALRMDDAFELVAGCFGRDPKNTIATGEELGLDPARCYPTWEALIEGESRLPADQRIEAISIVTPNHVHHAPAKAAMEAGFHVICDKPLCISQEQADDLASTVEKSGMVFALTHNYSASPMVREARERIARGELGTIRKVYVEYLQGWLSDKLEESGQKQADWRTDPTRSGPVGALGDIGTHAHQLLEFVTGERVTSIYAILDTFVEGRALDDDDMILLKMANGATGTLCSSQVCFGKENGLKLRIFGTEGAIEWEQEHPNDLKVTGTDQSMTTIRTATAAAGEESASLTRTPAGHPEGYLEAFANIYRAFARAVRGQDQPLADPFPTIEDGVRGIQFIGAALLSSEENRWVDIPD
ncbi:MAG: Gfo/Idh/MocA family oxidoreductase [Planctomycetota bacterium]|jgi:predicted dehydrogenase|nr:Gfo/Idh/MocA family oxidoreductase [Planctomycetota bacterium]